MSNRNASLNERRIKALPRGISCPNPQFAARASGASIVDMDGMEFIDFASGIGVNNVGNNHPAVVEAIVDQSSKAWNPRAGAGGGVGKVATLGRRGPYPRGAGVRALSSIASEVGRGEVDPGCKRNGASMRSAYVLLILANMLWGASMVAAKISVSDMGPMAAAFWRNLFSVIVLGAISWRELKTIALARSRWIEVFWLGFMGVFVYNLFLFFGVKHTEPGEASIVMTSAPAATAFLSAIVLKENLGPLKFAGFAISGIGALYVLVGSDFGRVLRLDFGFGAWMIMGAVLAWSVYVLISKKSMTNFSPSAVTAATFCLGLPMSLAASWAEGATLAALHAPLRAWGSIAFMGVMSSAVGYCFFNIGVAKVGASTASVFIYLIPCFALLISHFMLGEVVTFPKVLGGLVVVAGVLLTTRFHD